MRRREDCRTFAVFQSQVIDRQRRAKSVRRDRQAAEFERIIGGDLLIERLRDARPQARENNRALGQIKPHQRDGDDADQHETAARTHKPARQPDEKRKLRAQRAAQHSGCMHFAPDEGVPGLAHAANIVAVIDQTGSGPSATD